VLERLRQGQGRGSRSVVRRHDRRQRDPGFGQRSPNPNRAGTGDAHGALGRAAAPGSAVAAGSSCFAPGGPACALLGLAPSTLGLAAASADGRSGTFDCTMPLGFGAPGALAVALSAGAAPKSKMEGPEECEPSNAVSTTPNAAIVIATKKMPRPLTQACLESFPALAS